MGRRLWVTVKPRAKREGIQEHTTGEWVVSVRAPARDGKANDRLVELLSEYFHLAKTHVRILRGHGARRKLVEID